MALLGFQLSLDFYFENTKHRIWALLHFCILIPSAQLISSSGSCHSPNLLFSFAWHLLLKSFIEGFLFLNASIILFIFESLLCSFPKMINFDNSVASSFSLLKNFSGIFVNFVFNQNTHGKMIVDKTLIDSFLQKFQKQ